MNFLEIFWPSHWRALWRSGYIIQRCVTIYTPKAKLKVVWFSQNIFNKKPIHVHFKLDFSVHFPFHLFLGRTCHKRINIDKLNKESKSTCEFHTHHEVLGNLHKLQYICEKKKVWQSQTCLNEKLSCYTIAFSKLQWWLIEIRSFNKITQLISTTGNMQCIGSL